MRVRTADSDLKMKVQRLAQRGHDLADVRRGLDETLRASVGYHAAMFSTVDPATALWTSCDVFGMDPDPARDHALFDLEFLGRDVNLFHDIARAPVPVGRLRAATHGNPGVSARYESMLASLGVVDEMRVVLRSRDAVWGALALYRTDPESAPFSERDERVIGESSARMADLVRLSLLRAAVESPASIDQPPGLLYVAPDGAIEATMPSATAWLEALDDRTRGPSAVRVVARAAMAGDGLARAALAARDGRWVELHSSVVHEAAGGGPGVVEVIVEGARPIQLSDTIVRAHGFSAREREVAGLVVRGRSPAEIADILGISELMVRDHGRAVFAKTRTASRNELAAMIFERYYAPRNAAGAMPGPYGWYLESPSPPGS